MENKTLQEYLQEQKELYKKYTAPADRELITMVANKIKREIEKGEIEQ
ncbi:hypothetical protein [Romboutsia lituseburensis]|uniref:Uncharacterized protein n=1 Tax=Romboutsia lituseburensis DSM 797 TaxID=1121325 RepID=A0A1G9U236_9FIRM|nr:hypothetical protein [Romboutsia lituseburensis]CEH34750.1 Hypothetical protein RLITU_2167 [Romboutsia lituseburensis]SDM54019.1 hypothetical protein SAMN04515677_11459 [Romboutsia lituseburensis DSM 797]